MGNETERSLQLDLINLDIEEIKVNRELYNLQLQINAKLPNEKKIKIKNNYKEFSERKLKALEEKKRALIENENKENNEQDNKPRNKMIIIPEIENEENKNNNEENKLSLISNSSKGSQKNNNIIDKIVTNDFNNDNKENNVNNKKEIISNSSESEIKVTTIYTRKKSKKLKNLENKKEDNINNNEEDIKKEENNDDNNNRYNLEKDNNIINEDLDENLNINEYKRKFFDKLSSLYAKSNINKSMDNKNSSIVEELEVVGLSQNDILKDKLSDFFVGTSVASSSNQNKNNSSMHNNYYKNRPKSEISGINQQLISGSKNNTNSQNDDGITNSINIQNQICEGDNEEIMDKENEKKNGLVATGEKLDTEETINNKETGNNTDEKDKEKHKEKHNGIIINEKKLLKNHRNRAFINLENSFSENSPFKESEDLE